MAENFYAYQFTVAHRPTVHRGSCPHCRDGQGQRKTPRPTPEGGVSAWWRLVDVTEENVAEFALRERMRLCGQCFADKRVR